MGQLTVVVAIVKMLENTSSHSYTLANFLVVVVVVALVRVEALLVESHLTAIVGDEAVLQCDLLPDIGGHIVWRAGTRILFAGEMRIRRDKRLAVVNNHLVISEVRRGDRGEYTCETESLSGDVVTRVLYLDILSPPSVHIVGGDGVLTVREGAMLELTCVGKGVPSPLVSWFVEDRVILTNTGLATLQLDSVGYDDAGEVTCVADNGVGDMAVDVITINILGKTFNPFFIFKNKFFSGPPTISLTKSFSDCSLLLNCSVQAFPDSTLSWWYNGELLGPQNNQIISSPSSKLIKVSMCDLGSVGEYVCEAENMIGRVRKSFMLSREDVLENSRRNMEVNFIYQQALPLVSISSSTPQLKNISHLLFILSILCVI